MYPPSTIESNIDPMEIKDVFSTDITSLQDFIAGRYIRNSVFVLFSLGTKQMFAMMMVC
jgi:hypothetical protein